MTRRRQRASLTRVAPRAGIPTLLVAAVLWLAGCSANSGPENVPAEPAEPNEPPLPAVSIAQAEQAMSDAMLASALSLFLAFNAKQGDSSVTNDAGTLALTWDDSADFTTGVGVYTITMTGYTMPEDNPAAADYNGYVLSGTVVMGSADGVSTTMQMDLTTTHLDSENFPVRSIEVSLDGIRETGDQLPIGEIRINGHEMDFEDLAQSLELGS